MKFFSILAILSLGVIAFVFAFSREEENNGFSYSISPADEKMYLTQDGTRDGAPKFYNASSVVIPQSNLSATSSEEIVEEESDEELDQKPKPIEKPARRPRPVKKPKPVEKPKVIPQDLGHGPLMSFDMGSLTPNQGTEGGDALTREEHRASCGPAAVTAFLRFSGQDISFVSVVQASRQYGWNESLGMSTGPHGVWQILQSYGLKVEMEPIDWERVKREVSSGKPVIIDTPGHYFVAERYDAKTGSYDFANTALVLGKGNKRWYRADEMASFGRGEPRMAFYLL